MSQFKLGVTISDLPSLLSSVKVVSETHPPRTYPLLKSNILVFHSTGTRIGERVKLEEAGRWVFGVVIGKSGKSWI